METGVIDASALPGGLDLQATVESGQSYLWRREDGRMYETERAFGGSAWYHTVVDGEVIRTRQVDGRLEWEATTDAEPYLFDLLRLDDDLDAIVAAAPDDELIREAYDAYRGMRLVRDPPFGCLISFICSAQMRVSRIHSMVTALAEAYGDPVEFDGVTYRAFPTPEQLAEATEAELRDLGLGYRAPYVVRTAEMVADGEAHPADARELPYEEARDYVTQFVGVGDKVADCVLLFSLDFFEAVPLDTWIRTSIEDYFPDCDRGNYADTSRAIRERFGSDYAGYVQTYVFHYLRSA
ncbi:DNA-3-methyladenine glycosylase 2 family protein [Halostella sp. JP-L12]|uniref:DNA-3-methyladenine glycosylase family protein n=1 Tax=Halostella TaxID=1843185 RepID=UPI000EF7E9F4|nr:MULTISPECIES: DNA glycosylase [Halostella]NHN48784.1 DNA-3-methyladenine glycosylase 2 family protein [Halostella sp. JP-L12]